MATTSQNIIKRESNATVKRVNAVAVADMTNVDLIPDAPEFVALRNATLRVNQALAMGRAAAQVMCANLAAIRDELNSLRDMNAKNANKARMDSYDVRNYAEEMFGLKKSQAYSYAKVGARFLESDGSLKSEYADTLSNVSPSVLGLLVDMTDEEIYDMGANVDKFTAANIRAYRRALKAPKTEQNSERSENAATETTTETATETTTETATETATETTPEESITFDAPTYGLHVVMEIMDDNVQILLGDGDKQRRRVYNRIADKDRILADIASFLN